MQVFAYIRVSTDEQAEKGNSLSEQKERILAYCKVMEWDEPKWYVDDGYSAKNIKRPHLTELIEDVRSSDPKEKHEKVVVTTKLDRLSRNLFDILNLTKFFDKYEFKYVSATESFDTSTAAGRLTLQVLGMVAEFERERNSERVRDNMLSLAGKLTADRTLTRPCFGYDVISGSYCINLEESMIADQMADMVIDKGPRQTVKWLNENSILTKEGNQWHEKVLREYLQRETLIGNLVYNKTYRKGSKVIKRPKEEWIVIEDHHDPILDKEKFEKLGLLFEGRKTVGRHMSEDRYLLSGLITCGHCGSKMNGKINRSFSKKLQKENILYRYTCDGYLKKAICFHHSVHRDDIENLVIRRIQDVASMADGNLQQIITKPRQGSLQREAVIAKLDKLDHKLQKQIEAYEDDLISKDDLRKAKQRVEDERQRLTEALKEIEEGNHTAEQRKVQESAQRLLPEINTMDRLKTKHAVRQIISEIKVHNGEGVEIVWGSSQRYLS